MIGPNEFIKIFNLLSTIYLIKLQFISTSFTNSNKTKVKTRLWEYLKYLEPSNIIAETICH